MVGYDCFQNMNCKDMAALVTVGDHLFRVSEQVCYDGNLEELLKLSAVFNSLTSAEVCLWLFMISEFPCFS